ncbi:sigma-70 family RNA polymerase sigma factor [Streptomyces sp. NPDC001970]
MRARGSSARPCCSSAATQMTRDRADAGDLVQETYLRAFDAFGSLAGTTSHKTWLVRFLADTALGAGVERQRPPRPTLRVHRTLPVRALERLSDREVKAALRQLPRSVAIVVHLADVEDFTHREIAEILGIPQSTVASRLRHGRRRLLLLLTAAARRHGLLD